MVRVQWARASQFNWVFDNMGGTPLQEAVAGNWGGAVALVQEDGRVKIAAPQPGGGQVWLVRGIWRRETSFPWDGFWADPLEGDLTNYYEGGSFTNLGAVTEVTLGKSLPAGTPVQLYYIYFTGERALKYEPLNNFPCIRRAYRSQADYTYDFATDRLLDLMVSLYQGGREQGRDYQPLLGFLWEAYQPRMESRTSPLVYDSFERQLWDRGAYLLYRGATAGLETFQVFGTELASGSPERVLHVKVALPSSQESAWFGYGLDWSLANSPFHAIDRVKLRLRGKGESRRLHNLVKLGGGSARLVLQGDYGSQEKRWFVIHIETPGEVGEATFRWSRDGGETWEAAGLRTGDRDHPVALERGVEVYWESGDGLDLLAGDLWTFWGGDPGTHPRRLFITLNDSAPGDPDPWGPEHTYLHALPDRFPELTAFEVPFSQFWRRDNLIEDGDRVRAEWGSWYSATQPDSSDITFCDHEETDTIFGDTFYTQKKVTWDLSPYATAFGVWAGIDINRCNSANHAEINFLIRPEVSGANFLSLRLKVKDARGSYFYQDHTVAANTWQRVTAAFADLSLESGALPLTHPIQAVDIGIPLAPPSNGTFYLTDLKFDGHITFAGAQRLRVLEFKIEQQGLVDHEWWLDEVGLNLEAEDPYPSVPRLAISLGPYGQNPWRGPTLVHYAHPLAPYLVGALNLAQNYVNLHRDAQNEFWERYKGVKGPILPVHTRNDIENIALCGEENFGRFCWWPRYRDYGKVVGVWLFNESLTDAAQSHDLSWASGSPLYTTGISQPGKTALIFDGSSAHAYCDPGTDFRLGSDDFTLEAVVKFADLGINRAIMGLWDQSGNQRSWIITRLPNNLIRLTWSATGSDSPYINSNTAITDASNYHHLVITRNRDAINIYLDGEPAGTGSIGSNVLYDCTAYFRVGRDGLGSLPFKGLIDYAAVHKGRAMSATEVADRWQIIQGQLNGSAYPEVGYALGQYWAFYRLAQYFFVTNDPAGWEILQNWLIWIDTYGAADGPGWKFPTYFSEYGFGYGDYDPGAAVSLALGCLYIYLRNGHETAGLWARRILDDLRLNRQSQDYGGGYKSDYHYAWLNALVAQAFGLAAAGRTNQAYPFASTTEDLSQFNNQISWLFRHSGDVKPNLLNSELIPFTYLEPEDVWDYAPHYVFMHQMGSLEGVVLMIGAALEYGKLSGDWLWFDRLVRFILVDNLMRLQPGQIRSLSQSYDLSGMKNLVRLRFADYDRDNSKYVEARDEEAIAAWGEQAVDLDFRETGPVILENPDMAQLLADRLLRRLSRPWELVELTTWLEGVRLEVGDTVALTSDFHGLAQEEFTVFGKTLDLKRRQVQVNLARPWNSSWAWAVDAEDSGYDNYAIDQASAYDPNWPYRASAG